MVYIEHTGLMQSSKLSFCTQRGVRRTERKVACRSRVRGRKVLLCSLLLVLSPKNGRHCVIGVAAFTGPISVTGQHQKHNRAEKNYYVFPSCTKSSRWTSPMTASNKFILAKLSALMSSPRHEGDNQPDNFSHKINGSLIHPSSTAREVPDDTLPLSQPFREKAYILTLSAIIGVLSGLNIAAFKRMIDLLRDFCYGNPAMTEHLPIILIPTLGGLAVGALVLFFGDFPPGLRQTIEELDRDVMVSSGVVPPPFLYGNNCNNKKEERNDLARFARKAVGAVFTLGTGNSLGPEGPSVEAGMSVSRLCTSIKPPEFLFGSEEEKSEEWDGVAAAIARNRLLASCGAAAGVSGGFNAPLSGVFFALEIVQKTLTPLEITDTQNEEDSTSNDGRKNRRVGQESLSSESVNISAILLSSVISALVSKIFLGNELALHLSSYELKNPLLELPLYLLLGVLSGLVAVFFSGAAQLSKSIFEGTAGPPEVQKLFQSLPKWSKPTLGSLICGFVGLFFPQILFFGYETLNGLLASESFPTVDLFLLLTAKTFTTAIAAASGLVGGTFAPSLFLGGMLGAGFHNIVADCLNIFVHVIPQLDPVSMELSDMPAYAMVGAASVLAALFRAPLTASLLLFECTRDYDVILPLMASAGVGSLVGDIVETMMEEQRRDLDSVSWGDLAMIVDDGEDECTVPIEGEIEDSESITALK